MLDRTFRATCDLSESEELNLGSIGFPGKWKLNVNVKLRVYVYFPGGEGIGFSLDF